MRNFTRRKGTPNGGSGEEGQLVHKKRYAYQKALQSSRNIYKTVGEINEINKVKEKNYF